MSHKMFSHKRTIFLYTILLSVCFLSGCAFTSDNVPQPEKQPVITITLMDACDLTEGVYNVSDEIFDMTLQQWYEEHPEVGIQEKRVRSADYFTYLSSYATIGHGLPDVFILPAGSIQAWSSCNLILDVTDAIDHSEEYAAYNIESLQPFISNDLCYGFPLSNQSNTIIVYDKNIWDSIGYHDFPNNWADVIHANSQLQNMGYDCAIGFSNADTYSPITYLLNQSSRKYCGAEWFDGLIARDKQTMFTDDGFQNALSELKQLYDSKIFPQDTLSSALDYFIEGHCPALILKTDSLYKLQQRLLEVSPERYSQLDFSFIPLYFQYETDVMNEDFTAAYATSTGIEKALVINAAVANDPDRLKACIEFCKYMTGSHYADNMTEQYGFKSFTKSDNSYSGNDPTWMRLLDCLYGEEATSSVINCKRMELFLGNGVWSTANSTLWDWLQGHDHSVNEIANYIQDCYEKYYMPKDLIYSKDMLVL